VKNSATRSSGDSDAPRKRSGARSEKDWTSFTWTQYNSVHTFTPPNETPLFAGYDWGMMGHFKPPNSLHTWLHEFAHRNGYVVAQAHEEQTVTKVSRLSSPKYCRTWGEVSGFQAMPRTDHELFLPFFGYNVRLDMCNGTGPRGTQDRINCPINYRDRGVGRRMRRSYGFEAYWYYHLKRGTEVTQCVANKQLFRAILDYSEEFLHAYADLPKFELITAFENHQVGAITLTCQSLLVLPLLPNSYSTFIVFLISPFQANPFGAQPTDRHLARYLKRVMARTEHANTIFILASDHGTGYRPSVGEDWGKRELSLPYLSVVMPNEFLADNERVAANLAQNSLRLTSHFDMHHSMLHLFDWPHQPVG
jgi:hypothetical protein